MTITYRRDLRSPLLESSQFRCVRKTIYAESVPANHTDICKGCLHDATFLCCESSLRCDRIAYGVALDGKPRLDTGREIEPLSRL